METLDLIKEHLTYPCRKSFLPFHQWQNMLDVQQAFLELWWREQPDTQKRLFGYFETVEQQSEQFSSVLNSIVEQVTVAKQRKLSDEQKAQFNDAIATIKFKIEHERHSEQWRLDLQTDDLSKQGLKAVIPTLKMDRPVLEKVIAHYLYQDFFYCELFDRPEGIQIKKPILTRGLSKKLITDLKDTYDWHEALFELWVARHAPEGFAYPFTSVMTKPEQTTEVKKLINDWIQERNEIIDNGGLNNHIRDLYDNKDKILEIRKSIENAYKHDIEISLIELTKPFDGYFILLDLFRHVLDNPFSFFEELDKNPHTELKPESVDNMFKFTCEDPISMPLSINTMGELMNHLEQIRGTSFEADLNQLISFTKQKLGASMESDEFRPWLVYFKQILNFDDRTFSSTRISDFAAIVYAHFDNREQLVKNEEIAGLIERTEPNDLLPTLSVRTNDETVLVDGKVLYERESSKKRLLISLINLVKKSGKKDLQKPQKFKPQHRGYIGKINDDYRKLTAKSNVLVKTSSKVIKCFFNV